jgi:hypothetical protein
MMIIIKVEVVVVMMKMEDINSSLSCSLSCLIWNY